MDPRLRQEPVSLLPAHGNLLQLAGSKVGGGVLI